MWLSVIYRCSFNLALMQLIPIICLLIEIKQDREVSWICYLHKYFYTGFEVNILLCWVGLEDRVAPCNCTVCYTVRNLSKGMAQEKN